MCAFLFLFFLRFYIHQKRTSLHFKQDWFTYLVQNIIPRTVLSVQVRGQEWVGGKKRIKNIFSIAAKYTGTQSLLKAKNFVYFAHLQVFLLLKRTTKNLQTRTGRRECMGSVHQRDDFASTGHHAYIPGQVILGFVFHCCWPFHIVYSGVQEMWRMLTGEP